jgi:arylsulfatase A-like enzyme
MPAKIYFPLDRPVTKPTHFVAKETKTVFDATQLAATTLAVALICLCCTAAQAAERPNVIVILSDDQGWGDFSVNGNTNLNTPHIDSLAADGASFDRFYVCPVCSPTRAEFLTGRYHLRSGVTATSKGGERMDLDETTIAETFKAAGYATGAFGKWHNGAQFPYHPNARGFDEFYGFLSGHLADYYTPMLDHNGEPVRGEKYVSDDYTDKTLAFIERNRDRPFFAYLAFNSPHSPMQVPDRWWDKFKDRELELRGTQAKQEPIEHTRAALAMCENLDWNVGRILERLDELKLADNTIVVYFCDNGPNGHRWNGGMKGVKASTDEGGVRSPLFIRWPRRIRPKTQVTQVAGAIDLLPTLAELAGISIISKKPLDGLSLKHLLVTGGQAPFAPRTARKEPVPVADSAPAELKDRLLFTHWNGRTSVRMHQFRLTDNGKLYDVIADPGQTKNLNKRFPDVQRQLTDAVHAWDDEMRAELGEGGDIRPFIVGHRSGKHTVLPAADGIGHGNVTWSSRHPNSSFFTGWKDTNDHITWDVEVAQAGEYAVELYYTCPVADVGSTIELSFNGARLTGKIAEPFDPPLRGKEHDRVPRGESYAKDFRAVALGTITLQESRGELTLRALEIPGSQVADVQKLRLTRRNE